MPERESRNPLDVLQSTLTIIRDQSPFKDPQYEIEVKKDHEWATFELLESGREEEVRKLRFSVNTRSYKSLDFVPKVVDKLPAMNSTEELANDSSRSPHSEQRQVIGRICQSIIGDKVTYTEYVRLQGSEDDAFWEEAEIHIGWTGIEGKLKKVVHIEEAKRLFFTGYEEIKEKKEVVVFEPMAAGKKLAAA